jgi:hypothetical protein
VVDAARAQSTLSKVNTKTESAPPLTAPDNSQSPIKPGRDGVLFDVDLTKGLAGRGKVVGGKWDKGWRVTGETDHIIWDPGYNVKNGYLEIWATMKGKVSETPVKAHWVSLHGHPSLSEAPEYWHLRTGGAGYKFSKLRIKGRAETGSSRCEKSVGEWTEWPSDDKTIIHVKMEWKDGVPTYTDGKGNTAQCVDGHNGKLKINQFRYAVIGRDNYRETTNIKGMRFLRVKMVDYDAVKR